MNIAKKVITRIKEDQPLRLKLALSLKVGERTISNYADADDIMLTTDKALGIISEHTGLTRSEILTKKQTA